MGYIAYAQCGRMTSSWLALTVVPMELGIDRSIWGSRFANDLRDLAILDATLNIRGQGKHQESKRYWAQTFASYDELNELIVSSNAASRAMIAKLRADRDAQVWR